MSHTVLSHTADAGVEASAATFAGLVGELAAGMFQLIAVIEPCNPTTEVGLGVLSPTRLDLVVDALSELLYRSEVDDLVFCSFQVSEPEVGRLDIIAGGVDTATIEPDGAPIKAVTYHDLTVVERADGWYGRVYFDV